ncbi:class I SAM-dependent methyltransferase [Microbacterium sp. Leaf320]|uniref:class I SAM-dependent methyltransferase n=1 Tax=Microbacterium sp. Leaf320 TaxID=1736334 RepID=UPI0006FC718E|nr:methyltransferase [Microbacterium sp. Leaf320]KQQ66915.1 SAM-dependent methyltransferase [Microbacterium sp. Leaf320]
MDFPYSRLRRWPDVEADNLQAYDATDLLLVERGLASGVAGNEIAVIGDEYGAITLALAAAGLDGVRVHQDLATGRRALARNADELGLSGFSSHELDATLLDGARLVLLQLPKALAELEEITDAVARWSASDVVLVAGGRVKHMTIAQNEVIGRGFAEVQAQRAERKSRLVIASEPRPVPAHPPFPVVAKHDGLTLVAHGGAFAGAKLDIGTRVLLEVLGLDGSRLSIDAPDPTGSAPETADPADPSCVVNGDESSPATTVVDLGCGTGALAASYALAHPEARVIATDRSAAAVASARATVAANGVGDRVAVMHDDAGSALADASVDVVLLNPPFHLGSSVHTGAATRLFEAAARILRPGGELFTVFNSSLGYRAELTRLVGATEQLERTPKFTVTRSIRR